MFSVRAVWFCQERCTRRTRIGSGRVKSTRTGLLKMHDRPNNERASRYAERRWMGRLGKQLAIGFIPRHEPTASRMSLFQTSHTASRTASRTLLGPRSVRAAQASARLVQRIWTVLSNRVQHPRQPNLGPHKRGKNCRAGSLPARCCRSMCLCALGIHHGATRLAQPIPAKRCRTQLWSSV